MENCYSFHTYLLKELKKSHSLSELVKLFDTLPYRVDIHKLSKWTNNKQPIPQKYLPHIEKLARNHLQNDIIYYISYCFGSS